MNFFESFRISIIALRSNKVRALLTMLGIIIGVAAVIILVSLGSGLEKYITKQIEDIGSNLLYVFPGGNAANEGPGGVTVNRLTPRTTEYLRARLPEASGVSGITRTVTTVEYQSKKSKNTEVMGIDTDFSKVVNFPVEFGRFLTDAEIEAGRNVAVIGPSAAENLSRQSLLGKQVKVGSRRYTVVGVLKAKGSVLGQDQDKTLLIPLDTMMKQFGIENVNAIYLKAPTPEGVDDLKKQTERFLARRISKDDFSVLTQQQTLDTIRGILGVVSTALGGIAGISLLVGGIGIMNIMLVSVTERTKEIGLRKAVGAPPSSIMMQFLIEAVVLSLVGGTIGIMVGYLVSFLIGFFITTSVPLWSVGLAFGFSVAVGVIFGVAPAIRASRLDPIIALRYE